MTTYTAYFGREGMSDRHASDGEKRFGCTRSVRAHAVMQDWCTNAFGDALPWPRCASRELFAVGGRDLEIRF